MSRTSFREGRGAAEIQNASRRRFLERAVLASGGAAGALLVGCGDDGKTTPVAPEQTAGGKSPQGSPAASQPKRGGILKVGLASAPQYLDPHAPGSGNDHRIFWTMFEGLITADAKGVATTTGALAATLEQPDAMTYVFKLRDGVMFHDGTPFNADAVKYNFDRVLDKATNSPGAADLAIIDNLELINQNQIKITTKKPWAPFLLSLADRGGMMVSPTAATKQGLTAFRTNPVGTGPFKFKEWLTDASVEVVGNDAYWDTAPDGKPLPYLDGIKWLLIPDATVRNANLTTGSIDMADDVEAKDVATLAAKYFVLVTPGVQLALQMHNLSKPPLTDVRVRQAMSLAVDRDAYLKAVYSGVGKAANGAVYPIYASVYDESRPVQAQDLASAKALLTAAGFSDGLTVPSISIPTTGATAEVIKSMWAKVGIALDNRAVEIPAYRQQFFYDFSVPVAFSNFTARADEDGIARNVWHSSGFWNPGKNESVDAIIDKGAGELDTQQRRATYATLSQRVVDDGLHVLETFVANAQVMTDRAGGFTSGFDGKGRYRLAFLNG